MDRQSFVDRILELENLTNNLEDDDADDLFKWGIVQVDDLISKAGNDEEAGINLDQLIGVMRNINSLAGDPISAAPNAVIDLIYGSGFGESHD
jgi:hypothetical protein